MMLVLGFRKLFKKKQDASQVSLDAGCRMLLQEVRVTETDGLALCFEESARYLWGHEVLFAV